MTGAHAWSWSGTAPGEVFDPDHRGAQVEAGEAAVRGLVVSGGDASPGLQLVDQPLDGVPLLVQVWVVADGPTAPGALPFVRPPRRPRLPPRPTDRADLALGEGVHNRLAPADHPDRRDLTTRPPARRDKEGADPRPPGAVGPRRSRSDTRRLRPRSRGTNRANRRPGHALTTAEESRLVQGPQLPRHYFEYPSAPVRAAHPAMHQSPPGERRRPPRPAEQRTELPAPDVLESPDVVRPPSPESEALRCVRPMGGRGRNPVAPFFVTFLGLLE